MRWARIRVLAREQGSPLFGALLAFKRHTQGVIADVLPEPSAALLTGILLGVDKGLPSDLAADFSTTGTSHIIAISGFNMALISGLVSSLSVRVVGRRYAAWFSTAAIVVYTLFVGAAGTRHSPDRASPVSVCGRCIGRETGANRCPSAG